MELGGDACLDGCLVYGADLVDVQTGGGLLAALADDPTLELRHEAGGELVEGQLFLAAKLLQRADGCRAVVRRVEVGFGGGLLDGLTGENEKVVVHRYANDKVERQKKAL